MTDRFLPIKWFKIFFCWKLAQKFYKKHACATAQKNVLPIFRHEQSDNWMLEMARMGIIETLPAMASDICNAFRIVVKGARQQRMAELL